MTGKPTSIVQIRPVDDIAVITIDDGKMNALDGPAMVDLLTSIDTMASEAAALVISGRPGSLSAGLDLRVIRDGNAEERALLITAGTELFVRMVSVPVPVVVSCTGHALGAGAMLLMVADYRIGTTGDYKIGLTEVAVGASVTDFGLRLVRARLASERTLRSAVLAETVGPEEAVRVGFLDGLAEEDVVAAAIDRAKAFAALPKAAFVESKKRFYASVVAAVGDG